MMKITKVLTVIAVLVFSTLRLYGQSPILGINAGGNISYQIVSGNQSVNTKSNVGYIFGTFVDFNVGKVLKITPEINFSLKGSKVQHSINNTSMTEVPTKLYYVTIPINAKLGFRPDKDLFAYMLLGPRIDVHVDDNDNGLVGLYKNRNAINFGLSLGAGLVYYGNEGRLLGIEIRYCPDITKYSVDKYIYESAEISYPVGTEFRNESLELVLKVGFR